MITEQVDDKAVKDIPPIPIKTYQWEELRRSKVRGEYPWTYLQKDPFDPNKMDAEVVEVGVNGEAKKDIKMDVDNPEDSLAKLDDVSQKGKVNPDEEITIDDSIEMQSNGALEQVREIDNSDTNRASYHEKQIPLKDEPEAGPSSDRSKRAKSEEVGKRKRKLSIDSSYSRVSKYSLSKLGAVKKKIKEAAEKIKLPRLPFTKSEPKLDKKKDASKSDTKLNKDDKNKETTKSELRLTKKERMEILKKLDKLEPIKKPDPKKAEEKPKEKPKSELKLTKKEKQDILKKLDKLEPVKKLEPKKEETTLSKANNDKPVYIHIPLKPPKGETDEFSHFEFEEQAEKRKKDPSPIKEEEPESPVDAPKSVQLIILTAPSDDEILDDITIPETPSEGDRFFDNNKLEELKTFAKNVADRISPETKRRNIPIKEESEEPIDKPARNVEVVEVNQEIQEKVVEAPFKLEDKFVDKKESVETKEEEIKEPDIKPKKTKKVTKSKKDKKIKPDPKVEDEEDGLKSAEAIAKEIIESETKAPIAPTEEPKLEDQDSTICKLKKTVSFKRRSGDKDDDYEDIASPEEANMIVADVAPIKEDVVLDFRDRGKLEAAQSQSMTVEEEKTYLDAKIMKDTSLDEDCSKWSKSIDHEYEPVNPPPEDVAVKPKTEPFSSPSTPITPTTPPAYDFNHQQPETTNLSKTPVHISTSSLERLASKLAEMDLARTGLQSERQSRTGSPVRTDKSESHAAKLQEALKKQADNIKNQAEKFKIRVKSIKRPKMPKTPTIKKPSIQMPKKPNIHMPKAPTFKISKPNISMPKMPERIKNISLSMPRRSKAGTSSQQYSTETNAGDSTKKKLFDFSTYPRIFRRKPKDEPDQSLETTSSDQRTRSDFDSRKTKSDYDSRKSKDSEPSSVRIPLHSAESLEKEGYEREDSVERRMRTSHMQYEDDIDIEDAYMRENREIQTSADQHNRWSHGSFHPNEYYDNNNEETTDLDKNDLDLSNASDNVKQADGQQHRRGVLEEINQDEFFLRQKGISQDNIEVGAYLSSEIREAFKKQPQTALNQIENEAYFDQNFDRASNKSLPETPKRKGVKKPSRRKKTPHVSAEAIPYDRNIEQEEVEVQLRQPERPSRKQKIQKQYDSYEMDTDNTDNIDSNILGMEEFKYTDKQFADMYENEIMSGIEQPNILVSDPYNNEGKPSTAPRKKNRSERSLELSEQDSMMSDGMGIGGYESILQRDEITFAKDYTTTDLSAEPPKRPLRTRSRTRSRSRPGEEIVSQTESNVSLTNSAEPCIEEPCVKDVCDNMGYSVISKHRSRADKSELPPPAPRRQKKEKFSTVPRKLPTGDESPSRPQRNYSTLVPNRPPRRTSQPNLTDEEKEVDISQYIEIESEDHNRDLHSGEVIQKMKDRPLPAPPRPPRTTTLRKSQTPKPGEETEAEASVQTEPLPDDFICEDTEHIQERYDRVQTPRSHVSSEEYHHEGVDDVITAKKATPKARYRNDFDHEETVTHGTLLVQPFTLEDGTEPQEIFSRSTEKIITVRKDYVDDLDDSEIPEEFLHFRSPGDEHIVTIPQVIERIIERPVLMQPDFSSEIELLRAHKLQVGDLDVDNLRVNELQASKITVAEIDSSSIHAQEITSRGGNLVVGGIELPASFLQQLMDTIKSANEMSAQAARQAVQDMREPTLDEEDEDKVTDSGQKKTSIDQIGCAIDALPKRPARHQPETVERGGRISRTTSKETETQPTHVYEDIRTQPTTPADQVSARLSPETVQDRLRDYSIDEMSPQRDSQEDTTSSRPNQESLDETPRKVERKHKRPISPQEVPPPIPPQPNLEHLYSPSRPPQAFYSLRPLPEFIDEDFPSPTRRRRPHHHKIVQLPPPSSSDDMTPPISRSSRRSRTPEPSISELTGQLTRACANVVERSIKRVLMYFTNSVMNTSDGKQDLHAIVVILLVLLAGLLLLGWGDSQDVHHHHWEYFNPPKDI